MEYRKTCAVKGDARKALESVRMVLMRRDFRIVPLDTRGFEATGPGMMNNQDPLKAVSRVCVRLNGDRLTAEADFGALRRFFRLMTLFLIGLTLSLAALFGGLDYFGKMHWRGWNPSGWIKVLVYISPLLPWPVLLPLLIRGARAKAVRTLDTLLENASGQD